jgi:threonine/homoserine/homoserine lactone efflux protein
VLGSYAATATLTAGVFCVASAIPAFEGWEPVGRSVGAMPLLYMAWQLMFRTGASGSNPAHRTDFMPGFVTATVNPITRAFFASQFPAMPDVPSFSELFAIFIVVGGVTFIRSVLIASALGLRILQGGHWPQAIWVRRSVGFAFAGSALAVLISLTGPQG